MDRKKKLRKILAQESPELLASMGQAETAELLAKISDRMEAEAKKKVEIRVIGEGDEAFRGEKGDTGESGPMGPKPEKYVDYFTEQEIREIAEAILRKATPVKGVNYDDGRDGTDGRDGVDGVGIPGRDGSPDTGQQIADKLNALPASLDTSVIRGLPTMEGIIRELKTGKNRLDAKDITNMPASGKLDQRWHGSGAGTQVKVSGTDTTAGYLQQKLVAGSNITLTRNNAAGNETLTIASTGGTGGITSINTDATAAQTLTTGTSGSDFAIVDSGTGGHAFNLPVASASNTGKLSSADWTTFNNKQAAGSYLTALTGDGTASGPGSAALTLATVNSNVGTFTNATITVNAKGLVTAASTGAGGGSGITRSISSVSTPTSAGSTAAVDYVYLVSGTTTVTLPTAVGNTNLYTIKRVGTGTVTVATTLAQTIDGSASASLAVRYTSLDLLSDGANWNVV